MADQKVENEDIDAQNVLDLHEWEDELGDTEDVALWENELAESAPEELEHEQNESERSKIRLPEIIFILLLSIFSEVVEWIGDLANVLPAVGQAVWLFTYIFGLTISAIIFLWSLFRGMYNGRRNALKLAAMLGGPILDALTAGIFPETLTLAFAIFLHNFLETRNINRIAAKLEKLAKFVPK